jgi:hypothetical protein
MSVAYATSFDHNHVPVNVLDTSDTFWVTTGLYSRLMTSTGKAESMIIYAATTKELTDWEEVDATNFAAQPLGQEETHQLNHRATSYGIKIVVTIAWGPFTAFYCVQVEGPTVHVDVPGSS